MARLKSNGIAKAEVVEPIKNVKDIKKIKQYLLDSPYIEDREDNVTKLDEALKTILN